MSTSPLDGFDTIAIASDELVGHLLAVIQEAVTNVGRHSHSNASTSVIVKDGVCRVQVTDVDVVSTVRTRTRGLLASSISDVGQKAAWMGSPPKRRDPAEHHVSGR